MLEDTLEMVVLFSTLTIGFIVVDTGTKSSGGGLRNFSFSHLLSFSFSELVSTGLGLGDRWVVVEKSPFGGLAASEATDGAGIEEINGVEAFVDTFWTFWDDDKFDAFTVSREGDTNEAAVVKAVTLALEKFTALPEVGVINTSPLSSCTLFLVVGAENGAIVVDALLTLVLDLLKARS